jgi:hypothetical protein
LADEIPRLKAALSAMPVPEPRTGFEDRVLGRATATRAGSRGSVRAAMRRPSTWWAAGFGALAATLACVALLWNQPKVAPVANIQLALNESRDVPLVIDSERELRGATIRLYVTGSVALAGYEQQHEIEFQTSLTPGANLLSLPLVARAPGDGTVVAEIEHEGRTRTLRVALHVVG